MKKLSILAIVLVLIGGLGIWNFIDYKGANKVETERETEIDSIVSRKMGNENSDIVVVYAQGGPETEVEEDVLEELRGADEKLKDALFVQAHQVQTENKKMFIKEEISFEQAIEYDKKTVENIANIVKYYKKNGKKVYVVGISFGAFVATDLIAKEGPDLADGYAIMVGRLDMNEVFWKAFSEGKGGEFQNGVTPVANEAESLVESNMYKLAAGIGHKRFTELLKGMDLSKVAYAYGKTDEAVGSLNEKEISFLKERGATLFTNEGGHSEASTYETEKMMKFLLDH